MDIKQALDILNLAPDACLENAKISFRKLAKEYHPDRFILNKREITGHDKMKDINAAFHLLKKVLKPKKKSVPETEPDTILSKQKTKQSQIYKSFLALLKKINASFGKSSQTKTRFPKGKPSKKFKPAHGSSNYFDKKNSFDSLLKNTVKSSLTNNLRKPNNTNYKQKHKTTYSKYMELKHKMQPKRKRINPEGFAPIEKISPVSPIKRN